MSYKALLSAKATYPAMYSNFAPNQLDPMMNHLNQKDDDNSNDEDDDQEYDNENGQDGSPQSGDQEQGSSQFNHHLKRCRFAPRQDVELLRELETCEEKPYILSGKAANEAWGKIANALNQKQVFGPLTLSALTCKLRFEFLCKHFGGHQLKFNPKRGTVDDFRRRDELIARVLPNIPADEDLINGKKRRGRPRKIRFSQRMSSADEEDDDRGSGEMGSEVNGLPSMSSNKRKPGRPRKIPETGVPFMDGAALADYISKSRERVRTNDIPSAVGLAAPQPFLHYMPQPAGLPEVSVVSMLAEYLKRHHESDLQFKREQMESSQREKSEERRLERERLEVQKQELEMRKAELELQKRKFELEQQERQVQLELMRNFLGTKRH